MSYGDSSNNVVDGGSKSEHSRWRRVVFPVYGRKEQTKFWCMAFMKFFTVMVLTTARLSFT